MNDIDLGQYDCYNHNEYAVLIRSREDYLSTFAFIDPYHSLFRLDIKYYTSIKCFIHYSVIQFQCEEQKLNNQVHPEGCDT